MARSQASRAGRAAAEMCHTQRSRVQGNAAVQSRRKAEMTSSRTLAVPGGKARTLEMVKVGGVSAVERVLVRRRRFHARRVVVRWRWRWTTSNRCGKRWRWRCSGHPCLVQSLISKIHGPAVEGCHAHPLSTRQLNILSHARSDRRCRGPTEIPRVYYILYHCWI